MLRDHACHYKKKFIQEITDYLPQNERRTLWLRLILAGYFARPEVGVPLLDLTQ
jgi:hypothetical protein